MYLFIICLLAHLHHHHHESEVYIYNIVMLRWAQSEHFSSCHILEDCVYETCEVIIYFSVLPAPTLLNSDFSIFLTLVSLKPSRLRSYYTFTTKALSVPKTKMIMTREGNRETDSKRETLLEPTSLQIKFTSILYLFRHIYVRNI
jgi:hypothetical protein